MSVGQHGGSSLRDAELQQSLLVKGPRWVLLFEAAHLRLMDGLQAEIDIREFRPWVEPFDQADELANLLGVKVPRRSLYARQSQAQPIAEGNLRCARQPRVVEAIVGPGVKHAVGTKRRGKTNRSAQ